LQPSFRNTALLQVLISQARQLLSVLGLLLLLGVLPLIQPTAAAC
jgi:hypothetical protein